MSVNRTPSSCVLFALSRENVDKMDSETHTSFQLVMSLHDIKKYLFCKESSDALSQWFSKCGWGGTKGSSVKCVNSIRISLTSGYRLFEIADTHVGRPSIFK